MTQERNEWMGKYLAVTEEASFRKGGAIIISEDFLNKFVRDSNETKYKLKEVEEELETWKQKYADEVQKRLALIGQMKE